MKRLEYIPLALLGVLAGFIVVQMNASPISTQTALAAAVTSDAGELDPIETIAPRAPMRVAAVARPDDDVRSRLASGAAGTYIDEILVSRDSSLARWPDRSSQPLRVWVQTDPPFTSWDPSFARHARDAFTEWASTGIPVRFTFVVNPSHAEIKLTWVDRFEEQISGKTHWARDDKWWITDGSIQLALHHNDGHPLDAPAIRAIALHEVGHLLGLDHTQNESNIMTPKVRVRDLSSADRATIRLLYSLPAGSVR